MSVILKPPPTPPKGGEPKLAGVDGLMDGLWAMMGAPMDTGYSACDTGEVALISLS
ncbi:hypothetical protein HMPREF3226_00488 [Prevotella corporis]|uniref:Uncharacterized protein n=1 Tax=Prevotella corporis TaxID=28128 RepID=A0A133QK43_9BACT|nr:hypothetical protein HMPREF3226_00488 [Prevotella corporis]